MIDEQNIEIEETSDEHRRRMGRERQRKYRDKNRAPKEIEDFAEISENWMRNDAVLLKENPDRHARLLARHDKVVCLEAEVEEIEKGVRDGRRAETLSALTPDPENVMPMPDLSFRDIKKDTIEHGTANYRAIEAAAITQANAAGGFSNASNKGEPLDEAAQLYVRFGFRLRFSQDTLQTAREMLILYALRSKDSNLDWTIVNEAIDQHLAYSGFSPNRNELKKLIQEYSQSITAR